MLRPIINLLKLKHSTFISDNFQYQIHCQVESAVHMFDLQELQLFTGPTSCQARKCIAAFFVLTL